MSYKYSGTTNKDCKLYVIDPSDDTLKRVITVEANNGWSTVGLSNNLNHIVGINYEYGLVAGYGNVVGNYYTYYPGTFGLQMKEVDNKNHGATLSWYDGALHLISTETGVGGTVGMFSCPSEVLQGNKIRFDWATGNSYISDMNLYMRIYDGKYDAGSDTDFDDSGDGWILKGNGKLYEVYIEKVFSRRTHTYGNFNLNSQTNDITIFIYFTDYRSYQTKTVHIYNIEILDGTTNEVLTSLKLNGSFENHYNDTNWDYVYYDDYEAFYGG